MASDLFEVHERIKYLREDVLDINQSEMSIKIGLKQGSLSDIERKRTKTVTDRVINDICREFNVSKNWLRTGQGEIFIKIDEFSLDEYARLKGLTPLEFDIIKEFMTLDSDARKDILLFAKKMSSKNEEAITKENPIDEKVENYRLELEAEQKGEISSVSEDTEEKAN